MNNPLFLSLAIGVLVVVSCIGVMLWILRRSLSLHHILEKQEQQVTTFQLHRQEERLQQLIATRQKLSLHNEELLRQLTEVQAAHENTCGLDRVMEILQPRLLTPTEEEQFRSSFNSLYPSALHRLRTACPRATRSDELLCMLVVLKQTNEEMARTLGISRPSVLQTRYRLRTKFGLSEGNDLDAEIQRIMIE